MTNTATEVQIDDFLAHYGVKGMKWGVRKPEDSGGDGRAKSAAGQPKWGSHVDVVTKNELKAYNRAVESLNKTGLATLNANPKYAGKKINPNSALGRKYQKDAQALFDRTMATKLRNANIRKQLTRTAVTALSLYLGVGLIGSGVNVALMLKDLAGRGAINIDALQHAADLALPPKAYKFKLTLNDLGQIEKVGELKEVTVPAELKHVDDVDEFLAHYGVKGMKWGVRKRDGASASKVGDAFPDSNRYGLSRTDSLAYGHAQRYMNRSGFSQLNSRSEYAGKKLEPGTALAKQYERDAGIMFQQSMSRAQTSLGRAKKAAIAAGSVAASIAALGFAISEFGTVETTTRTYNFDSQADLDAFLAKHGVFDGVSFAHSARPRYFVPVTLNELNQIKSMGEPRAYSGELDGVTHADDVDDFLAHYGVKGMKWGVRKRDNSLRSSVKAGSATLGEAHLAGMKSTGHRVTNAILGDKHYWTKQVPTLAGIAAVGTGLSLGIPELLPDSFLSDLTARAYDMNSVEEFYRNVADSHGMVETGRGIARTAGMAATMVGANIYGYYAQGSNLGRAIFGNRSLRKNYEALGEAALKAQTTGNKRTQRILNRRGSIAKRDLRHADGELTLGQMYELMPEPTRDLFDTIVGAALSDVDISGETALVEGYDALSEKHKDFIDFIVGGELNSSIRHDDMQVDDVDEFLAHYGVKGMKWGVRKARDAVSSARAKRAAKKLPSASEDSGESSSSSFTTLSDAQKVVAIREKVAREGLDSVSNAELQTLVTRMNLTQQYNKATQTPSKQERARKFVNNQVKTGKTLNDVMAFYNSPAGQLLNSMIRSPKAGKHIKVGTGSRVKFG